MSTQPRVAAALAALVLAAAGPSAGAGRACADLSQYLVAFASEDAGSYDIYTMTADGRNRRRLTAEPSLELAPRLSPDGRRIAFVSNRDGDFEIFVMNTDGTEVTQLTANEAADWDPDWSPDGRQVLWGSAADGPSDIRVMNADGSGARTIAKTPSVDGNPVWSPDGQHIAFLSNRDRNEGLDNEVYVMRADGSDVRRLTTNANRESILSWSPDGRTLAFTRHPWRIAPDQRTGGSDDVVMVDAAGGPLRVVAPHDASDEHAYFLADGCGLLFDSDRSGMRRLWLLRRGESKPEPLGGAGTALWASAVRRR